MSKGVGDCEEGEKEGGLGREGKGRLLWETPVVHFFWHWHPQCFILLGYDIIWKKHLGFTISGKQSNNLLSLDHTEKRPLLVIVHVLTVDAIRNWWAEYKNTGSHSRHSVPFSLLRFLPLSLPFLCLLKPGFHMLGKSQTIGDLTVSRLSQILLTNENSKS